MLVIDERRIKIILPGRAQGSFVSHDAISRATTGKIIGIACREQIVNERAGTAIGIDSGCRIVARRVRRDHVVRGARVNSCAVVVASVVGDDVVVAARDVDAGRVVMTGVVRHNRPRRGDVDADKVVVAIVIGDDRLC